MGMDVPGRGQMSPGQCRLHLRRNQSADSSIPTACADGYERYPLILWFAPFLCSGTPQAKAVASCLSSTTLQTTETLHCKRNGDREERGNGEMAKRERT